MKRWKGPTREVEECSGQARWLRTSYAVKLQQMWIITTLTDGGDFIGLRVSERIEWRDVPEVSD